MTVAWVFPGQGSQVVGMGRDVYERFPAARAVFHEADAVLGFPLSELCFNGPEDTLTSTENAQPALLTVSAALLAAAGWPGGFTGAVEPPTYLAGHSLGEYTALFAAGAFDFATALRLVRCRGELMAAATEGTMAAVMGLEADELAQLCAEASQLGPVVVANENAPGQLVVSGTTAAVDRVTILAKQAGAKRVIPLSVSAAFHSPLMLEAAGQMAAQIEAADVQPARLPVISNVAALPLLTPDEIRAELVSQVIAPVKWIAVVEYMVAQGVTEILEWGPGKVLTGLAKRIAPEMILRNISDSAGLPASGQWSVVSDQG